MIGCADAERLPAHAGEELSPVQSSPLVKDDLFAAEGQDVISQRLHLRRDVPIRICLI